MTAFRFFRSQRTRRRIPGVRFLRNQITSDVLFGLTRGQSGQSESNAPSRSTASDAALTPCPANLPRRRTREPSLSIRWEARHGQSRFVLRGGSGHGRQNHDLHVFQHGDLGSAVANRAVNRVALDGFAFGSFQYGGDHARHQPLHTGAGQSGRGGRGIGHSGVRGRSLRGKWSTLNRASRGSSHKRRRG